MTQQINLFDPDLVPLRDWCSGKFVLGLTLALILGTAGHLAYERQALKALLASASAATDDTAITAADPQDASLAELKARVSANEHLLQAVGSFTDLPQDNAARLRSLIAAMPEALWLQEIEFSVERGVRIAGSALDAKALAGFSGRLGAQSAFRGLPLHVFALQPADGSDVAAGAVGGARAAAPEHYSFLLSSIDGGRSVGGAR